jgi:hypothetical protein
MSAEIGIGAKTQHTSDPVATAPAVSLTDVFALGSVAILRVFSVYLDWYRLEIVAAYACFYYRSGSTRGPCGQTLARVVHVTHGPWYAEFKPVDYARPKPDRIDVIRLDVMRANVTRLGEFEQVRFDMGQVPRPKPANGGVNQSFAHIFVVSDLRAR